MWKNLTTGLPILACLVLVAAIAERMKAGRIDDYFRIQPKAKVDRNIAATESR